MMGDRSRQGRCEIRDDIHQRFLAIKARADAKADGIRAAYKAWESSMRTYDPGANFRGRRGRPKRGEYQQFFIEEPDALTPPVELALYADEVMAG